MDYKSKRWKIKAKQIKRRDKYLCQECLKYGRRTEATVVHHIEPADERPDLAFVNNNLISLCAKCHNKMHPEKAKKAAQSRR